MAARCGCTSHQVGGTLLAVAVALVCAFQVAEAVLYWTVPCDRPLAPVLLAYAVLLAFAAVSFGVEVVAGLGSRARLAWRVATYAGLAALTSTANVLVWTSKTCELTSEGHRVRPLRSLYHAAKDMALTLLLDTAVLLVFFLAVAVLVLRSSRPLADERAGGRPLSRYRRFRRTYPLCNLWFSACLTRGRNWPRLRQAKLRNPLRAREFLYGSDDSDDDDNAEERASLIA